MTNNGRFRLCATCDRNESVGFSGPPDCELKILPELDGSCREHRIEPPLSGPVVSMRPTDEQQPTDVPPIAGADAAKKQRTSAFHVGREYYVVGGAKVKVLAARTHYLVQGPDGGEKWLTAKQVREIIRVVKAVSGGSE